MCLREQNKEFPTYHMFPERQPILPEFASGDTDGSAAADADNDGKRFRLQLLIRNVINQDFLGALKHDHARRSGLSMRMKMPGQKAASAIHFRSPKQVSIL